MWKRLRERLLNGVSLLFIVGWLVCAFLIAYWLVDLTETEVHGKGFGGLALMIFAVPFAIVVAIDELVIQRIKYGPTTPGRRKRGVVDPDELLMLDERLKRRTGDLPEI